MKLILMLLIPLLLSGCTELLTLQQELTGQQQTEQQNTEAERITLEPDDNIIPVSPYGAQTENGYYERLRLYSVNNLSYYDIPSMQHIIVCSSPNCTHSDDSCAAYIGEDVMQMTSAVGSNELIYYRSGTEEDGTPYYRLELIDGTNRLIKEIASFDNYIRILAVSDDRIYLVENNTQFMSVDIESGRKTLIYSDYASPAAEFMSGFINSAYIKGNSLYLLKKEPAEPLPEGIVSYEELPDSTNVTLYRIDINTALVEELFSETVSTFEMPTYLFSSGHLTITQQNATRAYNLAEKKMTELPPITPQSGESIYYAVPISFINGYVTVTAYDNATSTEIYYHQNIETGEVIRSSLSYEATIDMTFSHTVPLPIYADLGDELIVGVSQQEFTVSYEAPDGMQTTVNAFDNTALIDKADYLANIENFRPFDNSSILTAMNLTEE